MVRGSVLRVLFSSLRAWCYDTEVAGLILQLDSMISWGPFQPYFSIMTTYKALVNWGGGRAPGVCEAGDQALTDVGASSVPSPR